MILEECSVHCESANVRRQRICLCLQSGRCNCQFLHQRHVLLDHFVELHECLINLLDTACLLGRQTRNAPYGIAADHTVGHPTILEGTMDVIVDDARRIASMPGVHGLDLLAYLLAGDGDPTELTASVVAAVDVPVIAAGSIDHEARVKAMIDAKAWGFTVGSALFQEAFVDRRLPARIDTILRIEEVTT